MLNFNSTRKLATVLIVSSAALTFSNSAFALDATAFIKQYQDSVAKQGQTFTYDSIELKGSDGLYLQGVAWKIATIAPIKAKSVSFSGIVENSDGSVFIDSLEALEISAGSPDVSVTFDKATMAELKIPAVGETDMIKQMPIYARFNLGKGAVSTQGKQVATMSGAYVTVSDFSATVPMNMSMEMAGIAVDTNSIPDPKFQKAISDLGYNGKFTGNILMDGKWSLTDGVMDFPRYDIVVDNVGTISMPFSIGGYTIELVKKMQDLNEKMVGMSEEEQGKASLQAFKDLDLRSFTFSFKDDSLTGRGMKFAAAQMGQPEEQLTAAAPMMIGMGMGQLQMPELTAMVSDAVGKFLANPGTISISVNPEKPVPFMSIAAAGSSDPKSLMKLLNIQVSAQ